MILSARGEIPFQSMPCQDSQGYEHSKQAYNDQNLKGLCKESRAPMEVRSGCSRKHTGSKSRK